MTRHRYAPALFTGLLMFVLGVWGIGTGSLFSAEAATRWAAQLPPSQLGHLLRHVDAVHGLYYAGMHVWIDIFGNSIVSIRMPSALGMAGAAALITMLGSRLTGSRRVGVVAGLLFAALPFVNVYAQNARSYALDTLVVAAAAWALLRATEQSTWRRWALYGAWIGLGGWLHEFTLLTLPAHLVTLLLAGTSFAVIRRWMVAAAAGVVVASPLIYISTHETGAVSWIRHTHLQDLVPLGHDFFGTSTTVALIVGACAVIGALPARAVVRRSRKQMSVQALAVPLAVIPGGLLFFESMFLHPLYDQRYVLYSIPFGALLAAAGVERISRQVGQLRFGSIQWQRPIAWAVPIALCLLALIVQLPAQRTLRTEAGHPQALGPAAAYVAAHSHPGDGILFVANNYRNTMLGYPADFRGLNDFSLLVSSEASGTFRGIAKTHKSIAEAGIQLQRIWVVGLTIKHYTGVAGAELKMLNHDFQRVEFQRYKGVNVALYERISPSTAT